MSLPLLGMADPILYGGNGGHPPSTNNGALVTIDQNSAAVTVVGTPSGVARLTGLAFDGGNLYGSTLPGGGFPPPPPALTSNLVQIDPATGALIRNIGPITGGGTSLAIADLSVQPGTGKLFGAESPVDFANPPGNLWTIDPLTGGATLVTNTGYFFDSIAFGPDGTLYLAVAQQGPTGEPANPLIDTIDPTTGSVLTSHSMADFMGALAVRPTDGTLFGSTGDSAQSFTVDPNTGAETLVGSTGPNFVGALAFAPVPEPGSLGLVALSLLAAGFAVKRRRA